MGFFDDYSTAVETYPADNVELEIIDIQLEEDAGDTLNVREEGVFEIRITNNGPLEMRDVSLKVKGVHGVLVRGQSAVSEWDTDLETASSQLPRVAAHGGTATVDGSHFGFKAPSDEVPLRDLIEVSLGDWTASVDHMHTNHAWAVPAVRTTYRDRVRAD